MVKLNHRFYFEKNVSFNEVKLMKIKQIIKRPFSEVNKMPRFDFNKPVKKQRKLLLPLIWLIAFPETIKRKLKVTKVKMKPLKKSLIFYFAIITRFMILRWRQELSFLVVLHMLSLLMVLLTEKK